MSSGFRVLTSSVLRWVLHASALIRLSSTYGASMRSWRNAPAGRTKSRRSPLMANRRWRRMRPGTTLQKRRSQAAHLMTLDTATFSAAATTRLLSPAASAPSPRRPNPSYKALPWLPTSFGQQIESDSQFFENLDSIDSRLALVAIIAKK